jgi:diketogulonate reductase-like aldo/keto reductase
MNCKRLGQTGVFIPEVGVGTWDYHGGPELLRTAVESGAAFIDTAESYGTDAVVGRAVAGLRDRVFLATKVSPANFRAHDLKRSADASLLRMGVDTIDLLQLHEPNLSVPIAETAGALEELVDAGKVRFIGVSNFSVAQLEEAQRALTKHSIVSNQVRYNLIDRTIETGLLQYCQTHGITVIAYSPLARGLDRIRDCDADGVLDRLARATGRSVAQIALNWCLCKDGVVAIPKGNSEEHILDNCAASGWRLTSEQIALLDAGIQYRRRTGWDKLLRRSMPGRLRPIALWAVNRLPRSIRRRVV